jgi:hypothetical protein
MWDQRNEAGPSAVQPSTDCGTSLFSSILYQREETLRTVLIAQDFKDSSIFIAGATLCLYL